MKWCDSPHCKAKAHCETCRNRDGGREWRRSIAASFEVDSVDWACPNGRDWGFKFRAPKFAPKRPVCCAWGEKTGRYFAGRRSPCFEIIRCGHPEVIEVSAPQEPEFIYRHCKPQSCKYYGESK